MPTLKTDLPPAQVMNRLRAHAQPWVRRHTPYRDRETLIIRTDGDRFWLKLHAAHHGPLLRHRADILCGRLLATENGCIVRYHIRKGIPLLLGAALAVLCFLPLFAALLYVAVTGRRTADIGSLLVTGSMWLCGVWLLLRSGAAPLRRALYTACKKE